MYMHTYEYMMYEKLLDGSGQSALTLSELHHLMGIDYESNVAATKRVVRLCIQPT